ncbi:MAG: type II secretion system protein [Chloroflexi bacterium]|nr:type II secretion system protein [Chloroflexota bacterium]
MRRKRPTRGFAAEPGFTLIEIAVVIVILSLLLAMIAGIATAMLGQQRREATRQRLAGVETAIALFVSQNQRLPCPADGTRPGTDANAGKENPDPPSGTCTGNQANGVVPWRALGLSEQDVTDGWGNRLTYRVSTDFVTRPAMNLTYCDPGGGKTSPEPLGSGGYCDSSCTSATFPGGCTVPAAVTSSRGLRVCNLSGSVVMNPPPGSAFSVGNCSSAAASPIPPSTGAAYVVISHGENGAGAYNNQGVLQAATGTDSGTEEAKNAANLALQTYYVDDFASYPAGTGHFDDFVLRPSILTVTTKAQLGPRAH